MCTYVYLCTKKFLNICNICSSQLTYNWIQFFHCARLVVEIQIWNPTRQPVTWIFDIKVWWHCQSNTSLFENNMLFLIFGTFPFYVLYLCTVFLKLYYIIKNKSSQWTYIRFAAATCRIICSITFYCIGLDSFLTSFRDSATISKHSTTNYGAWLITT